MPITMTMWRQPSKRYMPSLRQRPSTFPRHAVTSKTTTCGLSSQAVGHCRRCISQMCTMHGCINWPRRRMLVSSQTLILFQFFFNAQQVQSQVRLSVSSSSSRNTMMSTTSSHLSRRTICMCCWRKSITLRHSGFM